MSLSAVEARETKTGTRQLCFMQWERGNASLDTHPSQVLTWLPLVFHAQFKWLVFTLKDLKQFRTRIMEGLSALILALLCTVIGRGRLSSLSCQLVKTSWWYRCRAFSVIASLLWNSLPHEANLGSF